MARVIIALMVVLAASSTYATIIHVPTDQPTIQAGINAASNGDTVLVAPGTYYERVVFAYVSVVLLAEEGPNNTTVSDAAGAIVFPNDRVNSSTIEGFTISGATNGSGIAINSGNSPTIRLCRMIGNSGQYGAGVYCRGQDVAIRGCWFQSNTGHEGGGLAIDYASDVSVDSCTFVSNTTDATGASIYVRTSTDVTITRCIGWHNFASAYGGFLYACNGSPNLSIIDNTIIGNSTTNVERASGLTLWDCPSANIRNNIVAFNTGGYGVFFGGSNPGSLLEYNDVFANPLGNYSGVVAGTGSLSVDPQLADTAAMDVRLLSGSPCLDSGDPDPVYYDADGSQSDIGALGPFHVPTIIRVPADHPTIQAGIDAALNGDTVLVAAGTYSGTGNRDIGLGGKFLTLLSESGSAQTIIDCGGSESDPHFGIQAYLWDFSAPHPQFEVIGFTITGANYGVLVYGDLDRMRVNNVRFMNNVGNGLVVGEGCGILDVDSCTFEGNSGCGLGIWPDDDGPGLALKSSVFEHNLGGGLSITDALMFCQNPVSVSDCIFRLNESDMGGAIRLGTGGRSPVDIANCIFDRNHASAGGAIYIGSWYDGDIHLTGCLFDQNSADEGAAIGTSPYTHANVLVSGCTFGRNQSGPASGCIDLMPREYQGAGSLTVAQSLLAYSVLGEAVRCAETSPPVTMNCTNLAANAGGDWVGCIADQYDQNGNISVDPLFCDTANGNYSLYNFSPCAAANNSCEQLIGAYDVACSLAATLALPDEPVTTNVISHTPTINWAFDPAAGWVQSDFEFAVGTDQDWTYAEMWNPAPIQSTEKSVVYAGSALLDGATYYARVRSKLNGSWTPWYETSFRMNSLPGKPAIASPANGATVGPQPTLFVSNAVDPESDPLSYRFFLYDDPNAVAPLLVSDLIPQETDSTGWAVGEYLLEDSIYAWRCVAFDGYEYSDTSNWYFFAVNSLPEAPTAPAIVSPVGENLILYDMLPTFVWTGAVDPDPFDEVKYRLELSLNQNFTLVVPFDNLTDTAYHFADSLSFDTRYWWRVKALDPGGLFSTSSPSDFWTWTLGDINRTHDCTIGDVAIMIDHLFLTGVPIDPPKVGDVNATCDITIGDVSLMIDHLFIAGASFKAGCE